MKNEVKEKSTVGLPLAEADGAAASPVTAVPTAAPAPPTSGPPGPAGQGGRLTNVPKDEQRDIAKNLQHLYGGAPVQIRYIAKNGNTLLGYFDDYDAAAKAVKPWNGKGNLFASLHHIADFPSGYTDKYGNPDKLLPTYGKPVSIKAENVDAYNYFFVDIDPVKAAGEDSAATKEERNACIEKAKVIRSWLAATLQFPDPFAAFSGNGMHLLYPVNLPVSETRDLIKTALKALAQKFDDTQSVVDEKVSDPVRSVKVYGTLAVKGTPTQDRPHRYSRLLHVPQPVEELPLDKLQALAAMYQPPAKPGAKKPGSAGGKSDEFDPVAFAIEVTKDADPFIDCNTGQACLTLVTSTGQYLTCGAEDGTFTDYLLAEARARENRYLSAHAFDGFVRTTAAIIRLAKIRKEAATRIIHMGDTIFYNLMDARHQVVQVSPGQVQVVTSASLPNGKDLKFYESSIAEAQVVPQQANQTPLPDVLGQYLNLAPADQMLAIVTMITWFLPHIERAVILLNGPQGTGKSFLSQLIQRVVDPVTHDLPSLPTDIAELQLILSQYYLVAFDNISRIKEDVSNTLCKAVTGGTLIKRTLYTNAGLSILTYKNCVILNGIGDFIHMPDLLDRVVTLKTIPHGANRSKGTLLAAFQKDLPDILAKIFDTLQQAMTLYPTVEISTPTRLVEFEKWGYAIAQVLYGDGNLFLKAYYRMRYRNSTDRAQDDSVASVFLQYAALQTTLPVSIPSRDLYRALSLLAKDHNSRPPAGWPKDPAALTSRLERLLVNIQDSGYTFAKTRIRKQRHITIDAYPAGLSESNEEATS